MSPSASAFSSDFNADGSSSLSASRYVLLQNDAQPSVTVDRARDNDGTGSYGSTRESQQTIPHILTYKKSVVYYVLSSVAEAADLARAAAVCRLWRDVALTPQLWQTLLDSEHCLACAPSEKAGPLAAPVGALASRPVATSTADAPSAIVVPAAPFQGFQPQIPLELLQPSADRLDTPAQQLGRWLGLRRLQPGAVRLARGLRCASSPTLHLGHADAAATSDQLPRGGSSSDPGGTVDGNGCSASLRGASGCYEPCSGRLVILDQERQEVQMLSMRGLALEAAHVDACGEAWKGSVPAVVPPCVETLLRLPVQREEEEQSSTRQVVPARGAADGADEQQPGQQAEQAAGGAQRGAKHDLQVVTSYGRGHVATGHPDGRVVLWDCMAGRAVGCLPRLEGCGRGPVVALAGDGPLLAVAYGSAQQDGEVLVWDTGAAAPRLTALIKPSLALVVQSLALSARHGIVALRSMDGFELRAVHGGRFLYGSNDRRNTAILAAGDVLFVCSSQPSFLGNNFLEFGVEVAAVDLRGLAGRKGAGSEEDGEEGGEAVTGSGGSEGPTVEPAVVKTVSPPLQYDLRGRVLTEFRWDGPMQAALSGGLLLLRCLQFPLGDGHLAWPGLFAFRLGDLVAGLGLGRAAAGAPAAAFEASRPSHGSVRQSGGRETGDEGEGGQQAAGPEGTFGDEAEAAAGVGDGARAGALAAPGQGVDGSGGGAPAAVVGAGNPEAAVAPEAADAVPASRTVTQTVRPEIVWSGWQAAEAAVQPGGAGFCGVPDGKGSPSASATGPSSASGSIPAAHCEPSVQLIATPRAVVFISAAHEAWGVGVPHTAPRRDCRV